MPNQVEPYEVGDIRAPVPPRHLDYLAMDYESLKRRAVRFLVEQFPEDYNNFSESDYGILLLELWSFIADQVSFKIDYSANQLFEANTTEMDHMLRLARLIGYHPRPPTSAKAWISVSIGTPQNDDVIIPSGYLVEARGTEGSVSLELFPADPAGEPILNENIVIPSGSVVNTNVIGLEGEASVDEFISDGKPYQRIQTNGISVIYGSMEVWVNSTLWSEVEFFPLGTEKNYTVRHDSEYRAEITFGDNIYGVIPPVGSEIQLRYRIGGGRNGNIVRGAIYENSSFSMGTAQGSVSVNITNYESASGGSEGETIEDIRRNMPIAIRTQDRIVTGEDYRSYAETYTSVYHGKIGKAAAVLRQFGCAANVIDIYVLQDDGGQDLVDPSAELKAELLDSMTELKMLTDNICIKSGEKVVQDISIGVISSRLYIREKSGIEQNIRDRLDTFFRLGNWSFGKSLRKSELLRYLSGIPEITSLEAVFEVNAEDLDPDPDIVEVGIYQIIRPGSVQISFTFE